MRYASAVLLASASLLVASCSETRGPVAPSTDRSLDARGPGGVVGVGVCHRTGGPGGFILITIAPPAVAAHLAHGDGRPGDLVPGQPGYRFGADCQLVPIERVLSPVVDGAIRDGSMSGVPPRDGVGDLVDTGAPMIVNVLPLEWRGIVEFDISALSGPVGHAQLDLPVAAFGGPAPDPPRIDLYAYSGDGALTTADFAAGAFVRFFAPYTGQSNVSFDVTAAVNSLIASHASFAGFNIRWFGLDNVVFPSPGGVLIFGSLESPPAATLTATSP